LLESTNHIVVTRPGYELGAEQEVPVSVVDVRGKDAAAIAKTLNEAKSPRVYLTDAAMTDVSATVIREAARTNRQVVLKQLLPAPVADYVVKYSIYKNSNEI
jgi:nicotinic acid mononucleotide adenylyltransferase